MSNSKKVRSKWLTVRMTEDEYTELTALWKKTTSRGLSEYARTVLLKKPIYLKTRNISIDAFLAEIVALRKEFKAVGFNFNQVVHKLHTLQQFEDFKAWMLINEKHKELLFSKIKEIQTRINQSYELWLRDSQRPGRTSGR